ncbi:MAG TPA: hypothetical protein VJV05_17705 [Pyrinomonadaceae bacterium]|nr:hypothetical protein [Pyrinomonadaceae bacterium]
MKNLRSSWPVLGILLFVVLGCGSLRNMIPQKGQYFEGDAAKTAAQAVKDKIGKPFKVVEIFIDDNEFRVQAQDPGKPKNVDEYKIVGGFVSGPTPVQLGGMVDDAEKSSFPFDDIDFSAVPKFCKEALERADIEGGKIYRLTFQRGFALTDEGAGALGTARWHIEIHGARENVTAAADPKGKLLGVDLSRTSKAASYKLLDEAELGRAQKLVKDYLGARKEMIRMTFYDKFFMFKVPNAENPKVSDDYKYDINGLSRSGFVKDSVMQMRGEENFSIDDIDFANATRFFEKAKQRVGMPNASLGSLSVRRRSSSFDNKGFRTEWHVSLKSGVNEGSVTYDNDGNEINARKNGETIGEEK